jgi:hypothetical protein
MSRPTWFATVALALLTAVGCNEDDASDERGVAPRAGFDWSAKLEQGEPGDLLAALAQPHAVAREAIGPHRLRYTGSFSLQPSDPSDAPPPLDGPVVPSQSVADALTLVWATPEAEGPRFSLTQNNDHERGRDVIVEGGQVYTRLHPRDWMFYPLETDVYELWLDDAQTAPHDLLQFAAPQLSVTASPRPGEGLAGGDAIAFDLGASDHEQPALRAEGPTRAWREGVVLDEIRGAIVVDGATGVWLNADIGIHYALAGADGRELRGAIQLRGAVEPLTEDAAVVTAPAEALPLPQRTRYEEERARLLDGLAAP